MDNWNDAFVSKETRLVPGVPLSSREVFAIPPYVDESLPNLPRPIKTESAHVARLEIVFSASQNSDISSEFASLFAYSLLSFPK